MTYTKFPAFPHIDPNSPFIAESKIGVATTSISPFKPKKAGKKTAHVVFLLDDSASMSSVRQATIDGFNEFLLGQQESDVKTFVTLYKFDGNTVKRVFEHVDVATVEPLSMNTYNPRGMTNLYDGMGYAISAINGRLSSTKKKDRDSVTLVVLTDGMENASRKYHSSMIKAMVEACEGKEWSFMFLGANIDAFAAGSNLGFNTSNTLQYSTSKMGSTMAAASRMTRDMSMAKSAGVSANAAYAQTEFTVEERKGADNG